MQNLFDSPLPSAMARTTSANIPGLVPERPAKFPLTPFILRFPVGIRLMTMLEIEHIDLGRVIDAKEIDP